MVDDSVEIWFRVPPDAHGYPSSQPWEQLYATPLGDAVYRVGNIPFFARGIAFGDTVTAHTTEAGWLEFGDVVGRSGHSTFRLWVAEQVRDVEAVARQLKDYGCQVERTLERLLAVDVPPDLEESVWQFLQAGKQRGEWALQVGYSPD